jgi:hypothetical protein
MLKLLERSIATLQGRLLLVAPEHVQVRNAAPFKNVVADPAGRSGMLAELQRLRGGVYMQDGALHPQQLSNDGRHCTDEDQHSWHLLFLNRAGRVSACVWYRDLGRTPSFDQLRVGSTPLAESDHRDKVTNAVEGELARARDEGLSYAEVGGWAVASESRCTSEGLLLALGAYSLGRLLGGALGMTTATVRHASSTILRRLGGSSLENEGEEIPSYYDPKYRCVMELLRFDSRRPSAKYAGLVERLCEKLIEVPVLAAVHACQEFTSEPELAELSVA